MKIVVVGLGYVGLSNAVLLAQHNKVVGVDVSQERVELLRKRKSPIFDPTLSEFLTKKDLDLSFSVDIEISVLGADYVIVCTPTNYDEKTDCFDTSTVESVIERVILIEPKACIVIKSTIPIGFVNNVRKRLNTEAVIFSPEFLREGSALYDNLYPSRIIVGEKSKRSKIFANLLKQAAIKKKIDILFTGTREAEDIKLFANYHLAMRVAFFNELDSYALMHHLEVSEIIDGISLDPRIGNHYNNPSFGYGGYCLPKDTKQLLSNFSSTPQNMITAIIKSNSTRKDFLANQIIRKRPKTVGIYRLAMKTGSDNFRQSSIQGIMKRLKKAGIDLVVYEPSIFENEFYGARVEPDFTLFKREMDIIIANRFFEELYEVRDKVFSRDVFGEN